MKKTIATMVALGILLASLTGCSNAQIRKDWEARSSGAEFQREKALFKERLGGKAPCLTAGMYNFTLDGERPSEGCLYPSSSYVYTYTQDQGYYVGQAVKMLNVLQTTPQGFLVKTSSKECLGSRISSCYDKQNPNVIFVYKTDETGVVDGAYLDQAHDGALYEYTGPFAYDTTLGKKTVYSFRKIPQGTLKKAQEGFKAYNIDQELYAELGAWPDLEKAIQKQQEPTK